ncbi:hypothetical protein ACIOJD_31755 [Streptomyces sp. NPDC088116]|uniref:hypothetical protein n=1 Tax=Streptomyces sp. NPDC088116 TaxID=3365825 RepID=UPI00381F9B75
MLRTGPDTALQALKALEEGLRRSSTTGGMVPCVPYAHVEGGNGTRTRLIERIAEALRENTPAEMGRLRLCTYDLVAHSATAGQDVSVADQVYARRRGRAVADRPSRSADGPTVTAAFFTVPFESLLALARQVHRHWWEWCWGLRLCRGRRYGHLWPEDDGGQRTYRSALRRFGATHRAGADAWDGLLLTALMIDLYGQARQGLLHPGRRRRRPRHAVLLNGCPSGADVVRSFLTLYDEKHRTCPNPAMVLIAALPPEPGAEAGTHTLADAARKLATARREALGSFDVTLPAPGGVTKEVRPVWRPWLRVRPRTELILEGAALAISLWLAGLLSFLPGIAPGPFPTDYTACLTGSDHVRQGRGDGESTLAEQYRAATRMIDAESEVARTAGKPERTVTIALIHPTPPSNENELRSGATIPDLRGVGLALQLLNRSAPRDDDGIWVRVKRYDAGVQYAKAPEMAEHVIEDARRDPKLIGVTGFTESRTSTVAALKRLDAAGIPIVTSTATAKKMEVGRQYHGAGPNNEREARVVADFARKANTIRLGGGSCAPAGHVVVVTDPTDVYSKELGEKFVARSQLPTGARIGYTPGDINGNNVSDETELDMKYSMKEVAETVCNRLVKEPRTLVYWTSRVREFVTFLDAFQNGECANKDLTVMGGNELTDAALGGTYAGESWLHLYHTAHTLPVGHPDRSATARAYNSAYIRAFGMDDLWLHDGHAALAHDAVRVFAQAASQAHAVDGDLDISGVHQYIINGSFKMEGASGLVQYSNGALRPFNKMLVMLHHDTDGSSVVLVCGKPGNNIDAGRRWRQGDTTYNCPDD